MTNACISFLIIFGIVNAFPSFHLINKLLTACKGIFSATLHNYLQVVSLFLDGVTGVLQDKLKVHKISGLHMMYAMNVYASIYLTIGQCGVQYYM